MIHVNSGREHPLAPSNVAPAPTRPSSKFAKQLRESTAANMEMRRRLDVQRDIETAQKVQAAIYELFTQLERTLAPAICAELAQRAAAGYADAHMNFDRELFADTGIGRPRDVARMFLAQLADPQSVICTNPAGVLAGISFDVWNNQKFTVRFWW